MLDVGRSTTQVPQEQTGWQIIWHSVRRYLKQEVLRSNLHTTNLSEATVVLVDDYCYFSWAIADLRAKGHW